MSDDLRKILFTVKTALNYTTLELAARDMMLDESELKKWVDKYGDYITDSKYSTLEEVENALKTAQLPEKLEGNTFTERVKYFHRKTGFSPAKIAKDVGMTATGIRLLMDTESNPRLTTVDKFVEAYPYKFEDWVDAEEASKLRGATKSFDSTDVGTTLHKQTSKIKTEYVKVKESASVEDLKVQVEGLKKDVERLQATHISIMQTVSSCMQTQQSMLQFQQTQRIYIPPKHRENGSGTGQFDSKDYQAKINEIFPIKKD